MAEKRTHLLQVRMSDDEEKMLERKFRLSKSNNKSEFVRKKLLNGVVVRLDDAELNRIYRCCLSASNNINQIAVRVNKTSNIYAEDIADLQRGVEVLLQQQKYFR